MTMAGGDDFHRLFEAVYVINLDERTDRWAECEGEFRQLGADPARVHRFSAVRSAVHGSIGCCLSHAGVLQRFLTDTTAPYALVLEDDFQFQRGLPELAADMRNFLAHEPRWQALLLAGNAVLSVVSGQPTHHHVVTSQTASAYVVTRAAALALLPKFLLGAERLRALLPTLPRQHWQLLIYQYAADMIWKDLQREGGWFILSQRTVIQRPSYSDIEQQAVSYGV